MNYEYHTLKNWTAEDIENILTFEVAPSLKDELWEVALDTLVTAVNAVVDTAVRGGIEPSKLYRTIKNIHFLDRENDIVLSKKLLIDSITCVGSHKCITGPFKEKIIYYYPGLYTSYFITIPDIFNIFIKNFLNEEKNKSSTITLNVFGTLKNEYTYKASIKLSDEYTESIGATLIEIRNEDVLEYKLSIANNEI